MASIKTFRLSPQQINALTVLAGQFPETFAMVCNDGRATKFEFPISDLDIVHNYTMKAGNRCIDLGLYDLSDDVIEFDQEYCTSSDAYKINRAEIEFKPGSVSIVKDVKIPYDECCEVLQKAGYEIGTFDDFLFFADDLPEVKWLLLAHFLINNPVYLAGDELPQFDSYRAKVAELVGVGTALAA